MESAVLLCPDRPPCPDRTPLWRSRSPKLRSVGTSPIPPETNLTCPPETGLTRPLCFFVRIGLDPSGRRFGVLEVQSCGAWGQAPSLRPLCCFVRLGLGGRLAFKPNKTLGGNWEGKAPAEAFTHQARQEPRTPVEIASNLKKKARRPPCPDRTPL